MEDKLEVTDHEIKNKCNFDFEKEEILEVERNRTKRKIKKSTRN